MTPASILAGICVAAIIQAAAAAPASFSIQAFKNAESAAAYSTLAAPIGDGKMAALIPHRICKESGITYRAGDKNAPLIEMLAQERLTGLSIFKIPAALSVNMSGAPPAFYLKQGDRVCFANDKGQPTYGIYIGMEHAIGDISFPLRLARVQFPGLAPPAIGQPCYDDRNRLVGLVLGVSRKGICHLLPARAISFLAKNPKAKRVRLGCMIAKNSCTPVIEGIINGGPLARGGIQTGDILIRLNNTPIKTYADMLDATYYMTGEEPLSVKVIRGIQTIECNHITPTLDER